MMNPVPPIKPATNRRSRILKIVVCVKRFNAESTPDFELFRLLTGFESCSFICQELYREVGFPPPWKLWTLQCSGRSMIQRGFRGTIRVPGILGCLCKSESSSSRSRLHQFNVFGWDGPGPVSYTHLT